MYYTVEHDGVEVARFRNLDNAKNFMDDWNYQNRERRETCWDEDVPFRSAAVEIIVQDDDYREPNYERCIGDFELYWAR